MKTMTLVMSTLIISSGILIYNLPALKTKAYEREVDALAFSYRVHKSQICPNRAILKSLRTDYSSTIQVNNLNKLLWVNNNFDDRFMQTCLASGPHRGVY
ncbi:hypothetical protein Acj9p135 [Acinetobacter phage Acj9]|uniref:Uncharacterized protein n=1 Tax=Acinetobacter phage Acj9 TaxID=760939 RepID=E5EPR9_9CAUD|nr:hypothetical protein Acj9p135 [Acinetobacter phage Acj9]ADG60035.1 hypothetical protein Acj9p135 [Acinetobacter phage Acj9]